MGDIRPPVRISTQGDMAVVRMQAPSGNAINLGLIEALEGAFRQIEETRGTKGVLLASAAKIFCPGLDLPTLSSLDRATMERFLDRFQEFILSLFTFPLPVVAAVSGHAVAGGCILALTADRRILRQGALIGLNEVQVGVPLPFGVAQILREAVNRSYLEEIALLGRNYQDEAALATGLAHEIREAEGFEEHCLGRLEELAGKDGGALAATKRYLRWETVERFRHHDPEHRSEFIDCWFSASTRRRIAQVVDDLGKRRGPSGG